MVAARAGIDVGADFIELEYRASLIIRPEIKKGETGSWRWFGYIGMIPRWRSFCKHLNRPWSEDNSL